jgi:preprotein translocase SecE subunit
LETRTEYVKNLRQIDEAYPDLRRKQWSFKVKKWFFGVGKEFSRVRWIDRQKLIKDFVIILIIVAILALLFLGLDLAILKWT